MFDRVANPLVLILLFASGLSAWTGDRVSFVTIVAIISLRVVLDVIQHRRALHAVDALRRSVGLKANVIRDGSPHKIAVESLVPGDVVHLSPGDVVPADCRLLEVENLYVNQSLLSGEAFPVAKRARDVVESSSAVDAFNAVFAGTSVISGRATALVCETGRRTELGAVVGALSERRPVDAFDRGIQDFGLLMMRLTMFLVLCKRRFRQAVARVAHFRACTCSRSHARSAADGSHCHACNGRATSGRAPRDREASPLDILASAGVAVKILTGDNERITLHLCRELGIEVAGVLTGNQVVALSDEALRARLDATTAFCRVMPQQKARIIGAFKQDGRVVGFLGDGINDASGLNAADVGISVDTAADVAKAAADLVLLDRSLGVVLDGIHEGRRTVENVTKYILMGASFNLGNMVSMAGAALFLPFLPMLPMQVLLNNLLYDLSEAGVPFDNVDPETVKRPMRWDLGLIKRFMMVLGPLSSVFDFFVFWRF